ncbi:DUF645 family protein, partial [Vibrio cholerae]
MIVVIWLSLSRTLNYAQTNLVRFKFWQPTSQLLALEVCLRKITIKQMSLKSHCQTIGYETNKRLKRD